MPIEYGNLNEESVDKMRRDAVSTVAFMLAAFEEVQYEAIYFTKAFEKGQHFLAIYG